MNRQPQALNCPSDAEHLLRGLRACGDGLTDFCGAGGMTYDCIGDRLTLPTTVTGNAGLLGSTAYGYDARGRLLSETSAGTAWECL